MRGLAPASGCYGEMADTATSLSLADRGGRASQSYRVDAHRTLVISDDARIRIEQHGEFWIAHVDEAGVIDCGLTRRFASEVEALKAALAKNTLDARGSQARTRHCSDPTMLTSPHGSRIFPIHLAGLAMRARKILQTGAFNPEDVSRLQNAFKCAWASVGSSVEAAEKTRCRELLATIVVSAGNVSGLDAVELAVVAIRSFEAIRISLQEPS